MNPELNHINKLLRRQIKKYYSGEITPELLNLFQAINQSYLHYEEDRKMLNRAMELSNVELEGAIAQLREQSVDLEGKNRTMEEFIFALAHDLKTPIRSIVSFNEIIVKRYRQELSDEVFDYLNYSMRAATQMHDLLTDLLDYASIANKEEIEKEECSLIRLVEQAMFSLRGEVEDCGVEINTASYINLYANSKQLTRVLTNIFSNAIKYQKEDSYPVITIDSEVRHSKIIVSVADNGIGIPKEYHDQVFEAFKRLHPKEYNGTGIGLAICKKIIEKHQGKMWIDEGYDNGTMFKFSLPKKAV